jgi:hypothetical protein
MVNCNPPFDWSPKSYDYDMSTVPPMSFNAPTVVDCLGRYLTVYTTNNPLKLLNGMPLSITD